MHTDDRFEDEPYPPPPPQQEYENFEVRRAEHDRVIHVSLLGTCCLHLQLLLKTVISWCVDTIQL